MKGGDGNHHLECMICGVMVSSVYGYHRHNVRQHSLAQLSRAILKLRNLRMPLTDPVGDESEGEDEEEEHITGDIEHPMEVLGLPVKVEAMDEVIELGPTDNADNLQIQSRLLNSFDEVNQHARQVIEVKENNPPPCHFNPLVEDPNAITVKFNKELVMAKDNSSLTVPLSEVKRKARPGSRNLRATVKRTIEIPNPSAFLSDYRKAMSRSSEKYIMNNINPAKRKRGRPRKNPEPTKYVQVKLPSMLKGGEAVDSGEDEEEDLEGMGDPPLFSDDEDEEDSSVAVPNIAKTRSGRTVKIRKEDGTFKYYDMPGRHQLDSEDLSSQRDWTEEDANVKKSKRGRKRKHVKEPVEGIQKSPTNGDNGNNMASENDSKAAVLPKIKEEDVTVDEDSRLVSNGQNGESSNKHATEPLDEYECFMCFKIFTFKEDCERHMHEHLRKVASDNNKSVLDRTAQDGNDVDISEMVTVPPKDLNTPGLEDTGDKSAAPLSPLAVREASKNGKKMFTCSVCNEDFGSQAAFDSHSHDSVYDCKFCGKKYQNRVNLHSHIKRYHEDTDWMKFRCVTCGKCFGFLLALERHMKEHNPNQKFCCEQCGKVFKSLTNLKNHIPLHTKDEIYECPYCPKQYYIRYSYEKHVRSHISPPRFHCEICNKSFNDKKYFEVHLERHQNGGCLGRSKDFRCNTCGDIKTPTELEIVSESDPGHHKTCLVCGKGHYKKFMLENIDSLSLQERPERVRDQCKLCGKFVINIARHVKYTHMENSYVPCDVCGVVVSKSSLPAHKNRKHGGSAVTCDHCNRIFKNVMCLREHLTKVRKKEDPARNICKFCKEMVPPELWKEHMAGHKTKCSDCGASAFRSHEEFLAHLEACRRCSNCGMVEFSSREEYLAHIEICGNSIDIMTGTLDAASDQEVVTSIFAIMDDSTCCGTCGEGFEDQLSLAHHITEMHPNSLPSGHILGESNMIGEAVLYACPQESCGVIVTSRELLTSHLATVHNS